MSILCRLPADVLRYVADFLDHRDGRNLKYTNAQFLREVTNAILVLNMEYSRKYIQHIEFFRQMVGNTKRQFALTLKNMQIFRNERMRSTLRTVYGLYDQVTGKVTPITEDLLLEKFTFVCPYCSGNAQITFCIMCPFMV